LSFKFLVLCFTFSAQPRRTICLFIFVTESRDLM